MRCATHPSPLRNSSHVLSAILEARRSALPRRYPHDGFLRYRLNRILIQCLAAGAKLSPKAAFVSPVAHPGAVRWTALWSTSCDLRHGTERSPASGRKGPRSNRRLCAACLVEAALLDGDILSNNQPVSGHFAQLGQHPIHVLIGIYEGNNTGSCPPASTR
jgi:hypothetical protein